MNVPSRRTARVSHLRPSSRRCTTILPEIGPSELVSLPVSTAASPVVYGAGSFSVTTVASGGSNVKFAFAVEPRYPRSGAPANVAVTA